MRNQTGHFYLNGNWRIDFPRARHFAGTTFHYERKATGIEIFAPEILRALGPTTEPLHIVVGIGSGFLWCNWWQRWSIKTIVPLLDNCCTVFSVARCTVHSVSQIKYILLLYVVHLCFPQLLYQETNLGISYEYSVPKEVTQAEAETYDWIYGTYSECSVECGGGEWIVLLHIMTLDDIHAS